MCADQLASGAADIGIVPSFELTRLDLEILPGAGIACHGPVRSILLISKMPAREIRRLAVDSSSRTSVQLARLLLAERYPALHIEPGRLPYEVHDLGGEWVEQTALPMVFAVWAGRKELVTPQVVEAFEQSCRYGRERIEEIVTAEAPRRALAPELVRAYLTHHIVHELGPKDYEGLRLFLNCARAGWGQGA